MEETLRRQSYRTVESNLSDMHPSRFTTVCLLYSGIVLLAQYALVYRFQLSVGGLAQLGVALSVLSTGLARLWYPETEERSPTKYGAVTYGMAVLALIITVIFLIQLFVL